MVISEAAPYEYVIRTCLLLLWIKLAKLDKEPCFNIIIGWRLKPEILARRGGGD